MQQLKQASFLSRYAAQIILVGTIFFVYGWFYNGANANQASRYDLVLSFCEPGTPDYLSFRINRFVNNKFTNTCDWARRKGTEHRYSNKAPGISLACIPIYFPLYRIQKAMGLSPELPKQTYTNYYLLNLWATVLPVAISALFFYAFLLQNICLGQRVLAWWLTVALYFGTLAFPFSTQLWGHTTAMALIVVALYAHGRPETKASVAAGAATGAAVLCDYSAGIAVVVLGTALLIRKDWKRLQLFCLAGGPFLLIYAVYHQICFGNPLLPATVFNNPAFHDKGAAGGMFQLSSIAEATWGLTFSPYRGLLWYMPLLLLTPCILITRKFQRNQWFWISLVGILLFFGMNISFNGWHGGWSAGPRYLIPSLSFYIILIGMGLNALVPWWRSMPKLQRTAALVPLFLLLAISTANMFTITSVSPMAQNLSPEMNGPIRLFAGNPLRYYYKTVLKLGMIQPIGGSLFPMRGEPQRQAMRYNVFNIGKAIGLKGRIQVVPPLLLMIAGVFAGAWICRKRGVEGDSTQEPASESPTPALGEIVDNQN